MSTNLNEKILALETKIADTPSDASFSFLAGDEKIGICWRGAPPRKGESVSFRTFADAEDVEGTTRRFLVTNVHTEFDHVDSMNEPKDRFITFEQESVEVFLTEVFESESGEPKAP